jgi:hypothetical protein
MSDAPSDYRVQNALLAWHEARQSLLERDADLDGDETALAALLGNEEGDVESLLGRLLRAARHAKAQAETLKAMADDMATRRARYDARAAAMRATALTIMQTMDWAKREFPDITASIRAPQTSVKITDESAVPDEYVKVMRTPDKTALMADLKEGVVIPGAELVEGFPSISVRTR